MEPKKISHTQLMALIWAGVLAPAAELLPVITLPVAGKGAWLAPLAAVPLVLLMGGLLGKLSGERGLAGELRARFGPVFGSVLLIIYVVWAEVLLALRLRLCARRLLASGYRDGALWFFLLAVAALVLWMGLGRLPAFARAGQVILVVLGVTVAAVLLLALPKVRLERVLPLWRGDVRPVLTAALSAAGVLGWGVYAAFLAGQVTPKDNKRSWYGLFWGMGGCLLLTLAQGVILGNLGPALAGKLEGPFFALAKSVGVEGAFQRVESVVAALWTLADLVMGVILLFAVKTILGELSPVLQKRRWTVGAMVLAVVLALGGFSDGAAERWNRTVVPWGNLMLGLGLSVLLVSVGGMGRKRKR